MSFEDQLKKLLSELTGGKMPDSIRISSRSSDIRDMDDERTVESILTNMVQAFSSAIQISGPHFDMTQGIMTITNRMNVDPEFRKNMESIAATLMVIFPLKSPG